MARQIAATLFAEIPTGRRREIISAVAHYIAGVHCLALQGDGKILVGGYFRYMGNQVRHYVARLNDDGTMHTNFTAGPGTPNSAVFCTTLQPDGKVLVGGSFPVLAGQLRNFLGRLNSNGTLDTAFNPGANSNVCCLVVQADGRIVVGGQFTTLAGQTRLGIGRLTSTGSADPAFNPGVDGTVHSLALQADGKIIVAGNFNQIAGLPRRYLGRLNPDGTVDLTFNPGAETNVLTLALQADGKLMVGGEFTQLGGQPRSRVGRLLNPGSPTESLMRNGSTITWLRGGTAPEVWRTTFEVSTNGTDWTSLGAGTRISGGWLRSGVTASPSAAIRARGFVTGGRYNGSTWFVESVLPGNAQPAPTILTGDGGLGFHTNRFGFNVRAATGQAVVIEASTNMLNWVPLQTNVTTSLGQIIFSDAQSGLFPHRLYRARLHQGNLPAPAIWVRDGASGSQAGRFGFDLHGVAGQTIVVEASTNLVNWTPLATNTLGSEPFCFSDPGSTNLASRFYRAR